MATELKDEFPLAILAAALAKFQPPEGAFAPGGGWTQRYGLYTIGQRSLARVGAVVLRRSAPDGGPVLRVDYRKQFPGVHTGVVEAEIRSGRGGEWAPRSWRVVYQAATPQGKALAGTRVEKSGRVVGDAIEIRDATTTRRIPRPEAFTLNWLLFDAVQRLPRAAFEPKRFTLLDDFDVVKANHTLSYRKTVEVLLGGRRVQKQRWETLEKGRIRRASWGREGDRPVRLHAYDHLGDGIVPEVYYVDDAGRLLFVVAGIEAYVWEAVQ